MFIFILNTPNADNISLNFLLKHFNSAKIQWLVIVQFSQPIFHAACHLEDLKLAEILLNLVAFDLALII